MKEDAMPKRPWTVTTAYYILWLSVLALPTIYNLWYKGIPSLGRENDDLLLELGLPLVFCLTLMVLLVYMIGRGQNWARILLLIQVLSFAPLLLLSIIKAASGPSAYPGPLYQIIQLEIGIVAVVLLFQRSSSRWFRAMEKLRIKDESNAAI